MNIEAIINVFSECELNENKICIKNNLHTILKFIKDNYSFKMLKSITAIDLGNEIELLYNLFSIENDESIIISIKAQNEIESITDIFDSAKADENEIYDMFGINFTGNKDLKRLYMPENWDGFPLRKDYIQDDTRLAWNDNNNDA